MVKQFLCSFASSGSQKCRDMCVNHMLVHSLTLVLTKQTKKLHTRTHNRVTGTLHVHSILESCVFITHTNKSNLPLFYHLISLHHRGNKLSDLASIEHKATAKLCQ